LTSSPRQNSSTASPSWRWKISTALLAVPLHVRPQSEWPMWLRAKVQAGQLVLAARLRVDEGSLRKRELDALPKLLEQIRQAKIENPALDL